MLRRTGKAGLWMVVLVSLAALMGCQNGPAGTSPGRRVALWNGRDFTGWTLFVEEPGVNVNDVWQIRDGVIYCAGVPNGYIRTVNTYENYHLSLEWRWPETPTNSGVLLHARGPDQVWPVCIECQLKAGSAGDFVLIGGTGITVDGVNHQNPARQFVVVEKKSPPSERPAGEWNRYDIYAEGGTIRCFVNGVLQNEGTNASVTSGWIALQSEGSPIEFRNIYIQPIK
jgi:hypothetical protein